MARNNRGRGKKGRNNSQKEQSARPAPSQAPRRPETPKTENGVFDFSEKELAEDQSLQVISRSGNSEVKFASFEDFLKNR